MNGFRVSDEVRPIDVAVRDGAVGRVGLAEFVAGIYPACELHGALLCMTPRSERAQVWRCDACGAGAEWSRVTADRIEALEARERELLEFIGEPCTLADLRAAIDARRAGDLAVGEQQ